MMSTRLVHGQIAPIALAISSRAACQRLSALRRPQCQRQRLRPFTSSTSVFLKRYTKDHEWIETSSDGKIATLGISTYAAEQLGDCVYVELPTIGTEVGHGDGIGAVESVKAASDVFSPVSGKIVEANSKLEEEPKLLNTSPEADGWIAKLEIADKTEMEGLLSADEYLKFTEEEGA